MIPTRRLNRKSEEEVGYRGGRRSLGADAVRAGEAVFHVHFDASDGKCSIRDLGIEHCTMLLEWDVRMKD
jgi:hypothetical protein